MWQFGATGLLNNGLSDHLFDRCGLYRAVHLHDGHSGGTVMDPVIIIAAAIIMAVEVWIRLL